MTGYGQFCPIAVACEVLAERWTLLVVRELLAGGRRFNELRRGLPLISPALLTKRLRTLQKAGLVDRVVDGDTIEYHPTPAGLALAPVLDAISDWGLRWTDGLVHPDNLDASLLMWDMRRNVALEAIPEHRVVVHFHLAGSTDKRSRYWLVLDERRSDLCLIDPGFDIDVLVEGHVRTLVRYWLGLADVHQLIRGGELRVTGPRNLVRALPTWFLNHPVTAPHAPATASHAATTPAGVPDRAGAPGDRPRSGGRRRTGTVGGAAPAGRRR